MSPDWAEKPEAVPYSSLGDPQSLNLYNYVGNNPLNRADIDGHIYNGGSDSGGGFPGDKNDHVDHSVHMGEIQTVIPQEAEPAREAEPGKTGREEIETDIFEWLRKDNARKREEAEARALNAPRIPPEKMALLDRYLGRSGGRWGGIITRKLNDLLARGLEAAGFQITNGAGRGPEEWIPGPGGGTAGGTWVDITGRRGNTTVRVQTITTLRDGITPTPAESAAAARIRQAFPGPQNILLLIPK